MNLSKTESDTIGEPSYIPLGIVVDESTSTMVTVRTREPLRVGEYVIVTPLNGEGEILGWVEETVAVNEHAEEIMNLEDYEVSTILMKMYKMSMSDIRYFAKVKLLSLLDPLIKERRYEPPRVAPEPGSEVNRADVEVLKKIFAKEGDPRYIKIGKLSAHPDVPFYINVNSIISRHLAIVAVTGAGKSNTVTVMVDKIVREKNGCVLIFDMHGEYQDVLPSEYVNVIKPKLDPTKLDAEAFTKLMGLKDAPKQELYLRNLLKVWKVLEMAGIVRKEDFYSVMQNMMIELMKDSDLLILNDQRLKLASELLEEHINNGGTLSLKTPLKSLTMILRSMSTKNTKCKKNGCDDLYSTLKPAPGDKNSSIPSLLIKFQDMLNKYSNILKFYAQDIVELIEPRKLNVLDLHDVDEETADVVVSIVMRNVLKNRKDYVHGNIREGVKYLKVPVLLILEEAHILAPANRRTLTKYWVSRITREGRKFGVGLCMVSQRPKGLDQDALSQANNMIVLKLIEPGDQRHVQASSEALSEELVKQLPSLATGEAIVLGPLTPLPAIVKIDKAETKKIGRDLDVVSEWSKIAEEDNEGGEEDLWEG